MKLDLDRVPTPCHVLDTGRLERNLQILADVQERSGCHVLLALKGFATFMRKQAEEETEHALKFYHYIFDRGGSVRLGPIPEPQTGFESTKAVFQRALGREQANTQGIHGLYKLASDSDDYATQTMLHWFINEQVEEEQWCEEALTLLEMVADNRSALLMLDKRYREKAD